jgi:hypothetical protein
MRLDSGRRLDHNELTSATVSTSSNGKQQFLLSARGSDGHIGDTTIETGDPGLPCCDGGDEFLE